jgi:hypothetical protein
MNIVDAQIEITPDGREGHWFVHRRFVKGCSFRFQVIVVGSEFVVL